MKPQTAPPPTPPASARCCRNSEVSPGRRVHAGGMRGCLGSRLPRAGPPRTRGGEGTECGGKHGWKLKPRPPASSGFRGPSLQCGARSVRGRPSSDPRGVPSGPRLPPCSLQVRGPRMHRAARPAGCSASPRASPDDCTPASPWAHLEHASASRPRLTWSMVWRKEKRGETVRRRPPKPAHNLLEPSTSRAPTAAVAARGPCGPTPPRPCPQRAVALVPAKSAPGSRGCEGAPAQEAWVPPVYERPREGPGDWRRAGGPEDG